MLIIILDTNVLYSDPFLEKSRIQKIIAAEKRTDLKLMVPEVVADELQNIVLEKVDEAIDDGETLNRKFVGLSGSKDYRSIGHITPEQRQTVLDRFEEKKQQLGQEGRILKYPCTTPGQLAQRSIRRQRPFQDKDRGMHDTIVWLNIKEYLHSNPDTDAKILLVSSDKKAFFDDDKDELHESLKKELDDEGISQDSVIVRRDLNGAIAEFVSDRLSNADSVKCALDNDRIKDFTVHDETVALMAQDWMYEHASIFEDPYMATNYLSVEVDGLEGVLLESIEESLALDSGQVSVGSVWTGEASLVGNLGGYLEESLRASIKFWVSSIIQINDGCLSVQSHEIVDVEVEDLTEVGGTFYRGR